MTKPKYRHVLVSAGRQWFPAEATGSYLRLSYGCAPEGAIPKAVETLARVARTSRRAAPNRR
ncbi:MAG: hypothetical protein ABI565_07380 [Vicinamibacteria bacterium]